MKIRNGFVSNSSSSSFIIGIAKVANEQKLKEILKKVPKEDKDSYVLGTFEEVTNSPLINKVIINHNNPSFKREKFSIEAPVNSSDTIYISSNPFNKDTCTLLKTDKKGKRYFVTKKAKWFAVCSGNDEGDGGPDSPFYQYTRLQKLMQNFIFSPLNWMSRWLLYPVIKILNKIFKKNWFYPYYYISPKSGYDKVKDHTFFKKEWQREIVKAFEDAENSSIRYPNEGIFSDDYGCHTYKIGAERNG